VVRRRASQTPRCLRRCATRARPDDPNPNHNPNPNPKPNPNPNPNTLGPPDRDAKLAGGKQRTVGAHGAVRAVALLIG